MGAPGCARDFPVVRRCSQPGSARGSDRHSAEQRHAPFSTWGVWRAAVAPRERSTVEPPHEICDFAGTPGNSATAAFSRWPKAHWARLARSWSTLAVVGSPGSSRVVKAVRAALTRSRSPVRPQVEQAWPRKRRPPASVLTLVGVGAGWQTRLLVRIVEQAHGSPIRQVRTSRPDARVNADPRASGQTPMTAEGWVRIWCG